MLANKQILNELKKEIITKLNSTTTKCLILKGNNFFSFFLIFQKLTKRHLFIFLEVFSYSLLCFVLILFVKFIISL